LFIKEVTGRIRDLREKSFISLRLVIYRKYLPLLLEGVDPWIGDINQHAAKKIQSSSFQLEIPDLLSLRSKRRKRSVIAASLKMPASPGLSRADKMREFGAVSQKMSAVLLSAVLREIVHE
jgi:hypothetical protein